MSCSARAPTCSPTGCAPGTRSRRSPLAARLPGAGDRPPRRQLAADPRCSSALAGALATRARTALDSGLRGRGGTAVARPAGRARCCGVAMTRYAWKRLDGPRWWAQPAHGLTRGVEEIGIFEHQRQRAALAGVQARHPLLDPDLLELACGQPPRASFDRAPSRPLLREAMAGLLPDEVRLRPRRPGSTR